MDRAYLQSAPSITMSPPPTTPSASPTPGLAGERSTKEGVGRGRSVVLGEGDGGGGALGQPCSGDSGLRGGEGGSGSRGVPGRDGVRGGHDGLRGGEGGGGPRGLRGGEGGGGPLGLRGVCGGRDGGVRGDGQVCAGGGTQGRPARSSGGGCSGREALALPEEGSSANPVLGHRGLGLDGEEGRGESGVVRRRPGRRRSVGDDDGGGDGARGAPPSSHNRGARGVCGACGDPWGSGEGGPGGGGPLGAGPRGSGPSSTPVGAAASAPDRTTGTPAAAAVASGRVEMATRAAARPPAAGVPAPAARPTPAAPAAPAGGGVTVPFHMLSVFLPLKMDKDGPRTALFRLCKMLQWPIPKFEFVEQRFRYA